MGCEQSLNSEVTLHFKLDLTYFRVSKLSLKKPGSTTFKQLTKSVLEYLKSHYDSSSLKMTYITKQARIRSTSNLSIREHKIKPGTLLKVKVKQDCSDKVKISFLILNNDQVTKSKEIYHRSTSIHQLKENFQNPSKLLIDDLELEDQHTLSDYNIDNSSQITVMLSQAQARCLVPLWKHKRAGFVVEGVCFNPSCEAYKQRVNVSKGMGIFDLDLENQPSRHSCPLCKTVLRKLTAFAGLRCRVIFNCKTTQTQTSFVKHCKTYQEFQVPEDWDIVSVEVVPLERERYQTL